MVEIFDLSTDLSDLPQLNTQMSKLTYIEKNPDRPSLGTDFPGTDIYFRWNNSGVQRTLMDKSFIDIELRVDVVDTIAPVVYRSPVKADDIAMAMGTAACLFEQAEFSMGGNSIYSIGKDLPQVDAIRTRTSMTEGWMSGIGKAENNWDSSYSDRQNRIANDSFEAKYPLDVAVDKAANAAPLSTSINYQEYTAANLNFDVATPNQAAFTAVGGILTFSPNGGTAVDIINTSILKVGDVIRGVGGNFDNFQFRITRVVSATVCIVDNQSGAGNVGAESVVNLTFMRPEKSAQRKSSKRLIWRPPLGVFYQNKGLPAGSYEIRLRPHSTERFMKNMIQSSMRNVQQIVLLAEQIGQVRVTVTKFVLNLCQVETERVDDLTYFLPLEEISSHERVITGSSLNEYSVTVPTSTQKLTLAFQSQKATDDTRIPPTFFKFLNPIIGGAGSSADNNPEGVLSLDTFYLLYDSQQFPQQQPILSYKGVEDYWGKAYAMHQYYTGSQNSGFVGEDFLTYVERGPLFLFKVPRDGLSNSQQVSVNFRFTPELVENTKFYLFAHHRKIVTVTVESGRIISAVPSDS